MGDERGRIELYMSQKLQEGIGGIKELKSFGSEENREKYKNKIKDEMRKAIKKENYFTDEEKNLINGFLQKIKKELEDSAQ